MAGLALYHVLELWLLLTSCFWCTAAQKSDKKNVLLIMFDDMRPEFPFYGKDYIIAPNFQRLADKSVIFDYAYCQVAVCNPSRNSLLVGLRPDTTGFYNFQQHWAPHIPFLTQFVRMGYNTAGYGKIQHWESPDKNLWSFDSWENNWYGYQGSEDRHMNSSVMPDKVKPETNFRDWQFTSRAVDSLEKLSKQKEPFLLALGFKLPHLAVHVPYKYFEMYKQPEMRERWQLTKKELKFPSSVSEISYRCCAEKVFRYMNEEGAQKHKQRVTLQSIDRPVPQQVHDELMMGYAASVTFLDTQLGRLMEVLDKQQLWENTIVVVTSDHGMHNGEKGIWEKWSLFEESTRVPLLIAHPQSPFAGRHYSLPVELIDIYPTLTELVFPITRQQFCDDKKLRKGHACWPLDGQSLAPVILGIANISSTSSSSKSGSSSIKGGVKRSSSSNVGGSVLDARNWLLQSASPRRNLRQHESNNASRHLAATDSFKRQRPKQQLEQPQQQQQQQPQEQQRLPVLSKDFAISQVLRCAAKDRISQKPPERTHNITKLELHHSKHPRQSDLWNDCDITKEGVKASASEREVCLLGYSMRTAEYRYTAYFHYNRISRWPNLTADPYEEELFDHKNETLTDFTHREIVNLAYHSLYEHVVKKLRAQLVAFANDIFTRRDKLEKMDPKS